MLKAGNAEGACVGRQCGFLLSASGACACRFQLEPIAAASLGQVHLARVRGERVVVKVQRPFLKQIFDADLKNIRVLAQILQAADPKSDGAARDWVAIYDECSRILYQVGAAPGLAAVGGA